MSDVNQLSPGPDRLREYLDPTVSVNNTTLCNRDRWDEPSSWTSPLRLLAQAIERFGQVPVLILMHPEAYMAIQQHPETLSEAIQQGLRGAQMPDGPWIARHLGHPEMRIKIRSDMGTSVLLFAEDGSRYALFNVISQRR